MIYPGNFEQKVGFDQVRHLVSGLCISPMGQSFVDKIRFSAKTEIIERLLAQTNEFMQIISLGNSFPTGDYFDLRPELSRVKTPGTFIEQEQLFDLKASLKVIVEILHFFDVSEDGDYPELKRITQLVFVPDELVLLAGRIIDDKGEILDNASERLKEIRVQMASKNRQVLRETKRAFEKARKLGYVPDNTEMTIRNGRSVIPLRVSDKRAIGGFIHDESASGQTVFVEPAESFELSNQIRELENEERREIIKILIEFTDMLRPYIHELIGAYRFLGIMDFIRAKALFSLKIKAVIPVFSNKSKFEIKTAVHPLLWLSHSKIDKEVVPLDLNLSEENRILLISGPNAGGKSVCLKTTGLLQYMFQCGLPLPVSPISEFRVFKNLFIDIGDEQSIENDLSTYSSHLMNMKYFLRNANSETLFLIDEFGTGTEPQLGGAIAEATLEQLNEKKAYGVITTHYTNLKLKADKTDGLINGAMLFDSKAMQPLYKLQIGKPGSSFAFEIAKKIGFPNYVLNKARQKSGGKHVRFDQQLQQLETDKILLQRKQQKIETVDSQLSRTVEKYTDLLSKLEKEKKQIIADAKLEALRIIENSNKAVEKTIREIKEANAEKSKTKEAREKLEDKRVLLSKEKKTKKKESGSRKQEARIKKQETGNKRQETRDKRQETRDKKQETRDKKQETGDKKQETGGKNQESRVRSQETGVKMGHTQKQEPVPGDWVKIRDTDIKGELVSVSGKDAIVNVNSVKLKTKFKKLEVVQKPKQSTKPYKSPYSGIAADINKKAANFKLELDLRGMRVDEALSELQRYIDDAILISVKEVSILHGKGNGVLRPIIREYLNAIDEIKHFGDASLQTGGAGITRVIFN